VRSRIAFSERVNKDEDLTKAERTS